MLRFEIITIFPGVFKGFVSESLLARGQKKRLIKINLHNLRKWTTDRHKTVDDRPFGGGPGMLLKIEPIFKAVKAIRKSFGSKASGSRPKASKTKVILFSPRGKKFNQELAKKWSKLDQLIFICGRYEGVDERVADYIADEVISVGDYVLNGGEVAAMAVIESVSRLVPGFIAKKESAEKFDHPQYTRPEVVEVEVNPDARKGRDSDRKRRRKLAVPKVLLSGDHKKIEEWRKKHQ